jgi:hypothetical protein
MEDATATRCVLESEPNIYKSPSARDHKLREKILFHRHDERHRATLVIAHFLTYSVFGVIGARDSALNRVSSRTIFCSLDAGKRSENSFFPAIAALLGLKITKKSSEGRTARCQLQNVSLNPLSR